MHFTLVFDTDEAQDSSYGLVFIPCPVWVQGSTQLVNLHPENPHYMRGDLQPLLQHIRRLRPQSGPRHAVCVVHPGGHGSQGDLDTLKADLAAASITVTFADIGTPAA